MERKEKKMNKTVIIVALLLLGMCMYQQVGAAAAPATALASSPLQTAADKLSATMPDGIQTPFGQALKALSDTTQALAALTPSQAMPLMPQAAVSDKKKTPEEKNKIKAFIKEMGEIFGIKGK